jgi:hypothetical protein
MDAATIWIWRVAGATTDTLEGVPDTIASAQFGSKDPDIVMVGTGIFRRSGVWPRPVTTITFVCEPARAIFRLRMSRFLTYMSALRLPILLE